MNGLIPVALVTSSAITEVSLPAITTLSKFFYFKIIATATGGATAETENI